MIFYNQLVVYKNRDRRGNFDDSGYSGVYDLLLDKEIIAPNKYYEIEIVDHNLFIVSNDVENALYGTLINEKGKIIGEEKNWKQVCQTSRNKSKYKYEASAMDGKYYVFNIKDNNIVDMLEISHDDFLRKY